MIHKPNGAFFSNHFFGESTNLRIARSDRNLRLFLSFGRWFGAEYLFAHPGDIAQKNLTSDNGRRGYCDIAFGLMALNDFDLSAQRF